MHRWVGLRTYNNQKCFDRSVGLQDKIPPKKSPRPKSPRHFFFKYEKLSWESNTCPQDRLHKAYPLDIPSVSNTLQYCYCNEAVTIIVEYMQCSTNIFIKVHLTNWIEFHNQMFKVIAYPPYWTLDHIWLLLLVC